ncbi:hypothetical protein PHISP_02810 [Aspergillus sp. HF37]|nr:hypothetical protein PHISP_02810 [Aspergillus sp. HF37]
MAHAPDHVVDQIAQLNAARNLVLGDAAFYPQIVNGILPLIGARSRLELRRWGSDFLAETFASPALPTAQKEQLAATVLQTVREILELPESDVAVLKSVVQAAARDKGLWEEMTAIKQDILRKWDTFPYSIQVCCVKFVQRVVQVQSHGLISDPRRPEQNETSLAIVPKNHSVLSLPNLEAEASGLLDRLLAIFQEDSSDPLLVNATLNCLPALVRSRQNVANKIINTILNFNPAQRLNGPMNAATRVKVKSMERTARALMVNIMKKYGNLLFWIRPVLTGLFRNPNHPLTPKMQQYVDRLLQSRVDIVDEEGSRKRGLPSEPTDGLDSAKRARLDAETPPLIKIPPLPPGRISYAQLYTLTEDPGLSSFDVKQLPPDMVVKIAAPLLARIDLSAFSQAIDAIRIRYQSYSKQQAAHPQTAAEEGDDDYEPEYQPVDAVDNALEQTGALSAESAGLPPDLMSLGPVVLPQPPPMTEDEAGEVGRGAAGRVFGMLASTEAAAKPAKGKSQQQLGFARLAGSTFDRDAWVVLLTRLATRAPAGLGVEGSQTGVEQAVQTKKPTISDSIRETLYRYILEDFRARLSIGITWLNEEWYNDRVQMEFSPSRHGPEADERSVPLHYEHWALRLLDGILPYLDARDTKLFIRFLSEIPEVSASTTQRVASLAKDPERVNLCVQTLLYVIMFRPPAREISLNTLEHVYHTYEDSRPAAGKILAKWRPHTLEAQPSPSISADKHPNPLANLANPPGPVPQMQPGS